MQKANMSTTNDDNQTRHLGKRNPRRLRVGRAARLASRWTFKGEAVWVAAFAAAAALIALSLPGPHPASAQAGDPLVLTQNLGSPPFANPSEIRSSSVGTRTDSAGRLRAIMEIVSGKYLIPNVGTESLRQYRGWDATKTKPTPDPNIGPGPTLRARVGDNVGVAFFNKADDRLFPYTFDTNSTPGHSGFGCDTSTSGYPFADKFPNCFHGSSTANIHFHGTHTSPDGLGDNVIVQVLAQPDQQDWTGTFMKMFASGTVPQKWLDMPEDYRNKQTALIEQHDAAAAAAAAKNKLRPPDPLAKKNRELIASGQWPEYIMGAFPNFFDLPKYSPPTYMAGQAPGTHWYHAHKHGSTALHILNGLAGAFVIESGGEGGYDHFIRKFYNWGDTYGQHEKILVFQQFDPTQNLKRINPNTGAIGKGSAMIFVNGMVTPTITMQPGEVQLWRLVNATSGNGLGIIKAGSFTAGGSAGLFMTTGFNFRQTAQDGVQFSPGNYGHQPFGSGKVPGGVTLAAGNRVDLLVQAPTTPGVYPFRIPNAPNPTPPVTLFFVKVAGTPVKPDKPFPEFPEWPQIPPFLKDLPAPGPSDIPNPNSPVKFQWELGRLRFGPNADGNPPHFMINNKQFGETGDVIDQCVPQGALQDWVLENYTSLAHPFHIHINPFQVLRIDTPTGQNTYATYAPRGDYVWQDVVAIPAANINTQNGAITPGRVTIRQKFLDFPGTFVLHCHILAHEDRGMMQLVRVVPAAKYPAGCQDAVPAHH